MIETDAVVQDRPHAHRQTHPYVPGELKRRWVVFVAKPFMRAELLDGVRLILDRVRAGRNESTCRAAVAAPAPKLTEGLFGSSLGRSVLFGWNLVGLAQGWRSVHRR